MIVVPIAFVSEHAETLVELDVEYRELADEAGVPKYTRVGTVDCDAAFIAGLAETVIGLRESSAGVYGPNHTRLCPQTCGQCPLA